MTANSGTVAQAHTKAAGVKIGGAGMEEELDKSKQPLVAQGNAPELRLKPPWNALAIAYFERRPYMPIANPTELLIQKLTRCCMLLCLLVIFRCTCAEGLQVVRDGQVRSNFDSRGDNTREVV